MAFTFRIRCILFLLLVGTLCSGREDYGFELPLIRYDHREVYALKKFGREPVDNRVPERYNQPFRTLWQVIGDAYYSYIRRKPQGSERYIEVDRVSGMAVRLNLLDDTFVVKAAKLLRLDVSSLYGRNPLYNQDLIDAYEEYSSEFDELYYRLMFDRYTPKGRRYLSLYHRNELPLFPLQRFYPPTPRIKQYFRTFVDLYNKVYIFLSPSNLRYHYIYRKGVPHNSLWTAYERDVAFNGTAPPYREFAIYNSTVFFTLKGRLLDCIPRIPSFVVRLYPGNETVANRVVFLEKSYFQYQLAYIQKVLFALAVLFEPTKGPLQ